MSASHDAARAAYDAALAAMSAPPAGGARTPADPYGRSILLSGGDVVFQRGPEGYVDLVQITGVPELVQGLSVLVGTPLGTDILNRALGLDVTTAIGTPAAVRDVKNLIRLSVVRALAQEPRVRQLQAVAFADEPAYAQIYPALTAADLAAQAQQERITRSWSLAVLFVTSLGESANLDVAGIST